MLSLQEGIAIHVVGQITKCVMFNLLDIQYLKATQLEFLDQAASAENWAFKTDFRLLGSRRDDLLTDSALFLDIQAQKPLATGVLLFLW